uniref:Ig-like domain-containing protein n=1 Tax=Dromaius novaehollandiae TaxID=8790 RepID=A0A8C4KP18_DRONO
CQGLYRFMCQLFVCFAFLSNAVPRKPFFKKKLTSLRLKQFGPAHFECRLTPIGDPTMVVEWLHDGKPLEAANRLRMINEFGYCSLDYGVAYPRDSGVITCRATNKYGTDHTSATLIVKDEKSLVEESQLPEGRRGLQRIEELERMAHEGALPAVAVDQKEKQKPEIVLVPEPSRVLEGETARFRCRVTGYPLPKVNWYLNGLLIRKSKRFRLRYDGIYYLDIVDCKSYDTGEVKVTAENPEGFIEHKLQIAEAPPRFLRLISDYGTFVGASVCFQCLVTGSPHPSVSWHKDGVLLEGDRYCVQEEQGGCHSLTIENLTQSDSGEYKCIATNRAGTAETSAVTPWPGSHTPTCSGSRGVSGFSLMHVILLFTILMAQAP